MLCVLLTVLFLILIVLVVEKLEVASYVNPPDSINILFSRIKLVGQATSAFILPAYVCPLFWKVLFLIIILSAISTNLLSGVIILPSIITY